jgi:hypothetical protein
MVLVFVVLIQHVDEEKRGVNYYGIEGGGGLHGKTNLLEKSGTHKSNYIQKCYQFTRQIY